MVVVPGVVAGDQHPEGGGFSVEGAEITVADFKRNAASGVFGPKPGFVQLLALSGRIQRPHSELGAPDIDPFGGGQGVFGVDALRFHGIDRAETHLAGRIVFRLIADLYPVVADSFSGNADAGLRRSPADAQVAELQQAVSGGVADDGLPVVDLKNITGLSDFDIGGGAQQAARQRECAEGLSDHVCLFRVLRNNNGYLVGYQKFPSVAEPFW